MAVQFGSIEFYEEMAARLNDDPVFLDKAGGLTCGMVYAYGPPIDRQFFVRFELGKVEDVKMADDTDRQGADFVVNAPAAIWRGVFDKKINPTVAMARGQIKVKGKTSFLLKNMSAFTHIIDTMRKVDYV